MSETTIYTYLAPREGSRYEQYFFRGRNLRAETLYRATIGPEPMTSEEVAEDCNVPVAAVLEAIRYAVDNASLLQREREEDWGESHTRGLIESPGLASGSQTGQ
jgi:hypothetical protein